MITVASDRSVTQNVGILASKTLWLPTTKKNNKDGGDDEGVWHWKQFSLRLFNDCIIKNSSVRRQSRYANGGDGGGGRDNYAGSADETKNPRWTNKKKGL